MKRILIIGSLFAIIFATSCKKEEMQAPVTKPQEENPLVLIKAGMEQDGVIGDLYYNKYKPEQKVFKVRKPEITTKACGGEGYVTGTYTKTKVKIVKPDGTIVYLIEYSCSGTATNCWIEGNTIYVLDTEKW